MFASSIILLTLSRYKVFQVHVFTDTCLDVRLRNQYSGQTDSSWTLNVFIIWYIKHVISCRAFNNVFFRCIAKTAPGISDALLRRRRVFPVHYVNDTDYFRCIMQTTPAVHDSTIFETGELAYLWGIECKYINTIHTMYYSFLNVWRSYKVCCAGKQKHCTRRTVYLLTIKST